MYQSGEVDKSVKLDVTGFRRSTPSTTDSISQHTRTQGVEPTTTSTSETQHVADIVV